MADDASPVQADEQVLRRVLFREDWYDPKLDVPIHRYAFQPMSQDSRGISVFRERFIAASDLAAAGPNPAGYIVAALDVEDIRSIDLGTTRLSVVADPIEDLPGHALIPELNTTTAKKLAKEMQARLAQLASRKIVYPPDRGNAA